MQFDKHLDQSKLEELRDHAATNLNNFMAIHNIDIDPDQVADLVDNPHFFSLLQGITIKAIITIK